MKVLGNNSLSSKVLIGLKFVVIVTVIAMILSLMLVFVMTACGSKTEPEPESEPQTETGHETTEESDDYDIPVEDGIVGDFKKKKKKHIEWGDLFVGYVIPLDQISFIAITDVRQGF